jgi:hypothetical protein
MGRKLMRVPMDFNWPINKTWEGYLNPHYRKCPDCNNGYTTAGERLGDLVSLLMLSGDDAARGKCHPYFDEAPLYATQGKVPSIDMVELTTALAGRAPSSLGHDACDKWSATKKIIKAAKLPKDWGICKSCGGDAIDPAVKKAYEAWKEKAPPKGKGFQLWETTSEGSPQSPVFASLDELCGWCAVNATTFGSFKASAEEWRAMLDDGFVSHREGNMVFM